MGNEGAQFNPLAFPHVFISFVFQFLPGFPVFLLFILLFLLFILLLLLLSLLPLALHLLEPKAEAPLHSRPWEKEPSQARAMAKAWGVSR